MTDYIFENYEKNKRLLKNQWRIDGDVKKFFTSWYVPHDNPEEADCIKNLNCNPLKQPFIPSYFSIVLIVSNIVLYLISLLS